MEAISAFDAAGASHFLLALIAVALTLSVLLPARAAARPFQGVMKIGARFSREEIWRLRKHYFHLFRVRGLTQYNASQALILAGVIWLVLRLWSYAGGSVALWLLVVAAVVLCLSLWAWQHVGPRATMKRFVSVFYLPVVFLVLYPYIARQAERAFEGSATYATSIVLPARAGAGTDP